MGITTDRNDNGLKRTRADGQNENYLVLSDEERAKGFVRPVREAYIHLKCGTKTTMPHACAETYARDPKFYGATFCCHCRAHFRLQDFQKVPCADCQKYHPLRCKTCFGDGEVDDLVWQFEFTDGEPVGSTAEEAQEYRAAKLAAEAAKHQGEGI